MSIFDFDFLSKFLATFQRLGKDLWRILNDPITDVISPRGSTGSDFLDDFILGVELWFNDTKLGSFLSDLSLFELVLGSGITIFFMLKLSKLLKNMLKF